MGKYATYRKRGSHVDTVSGLPVPETPLLFEVEEALHSSCASQPDAGGIVRLFFFNPEEEEYEQIGFTDPAADITWADHAIIVSGFYKVDQVGGGVDFAGTSPRSAPFEHEEP